jgi:hypothetical protein
MNVVRRLADRVLTSVVPEARASACKEYYQCRETGNPGSDDYYLCYAGCGRPTFCVFVGMCNA